MTTFAVVGDLSLDIVVAQSAPRREGSDVPATIRIGPGGQAANVAVRLARLGCDARLVAPMADDAAGRLLREALAADDVGLATLPATRSTVVIALLDAAGDRTMLSDRQSLAHESAASALSGADWIHASGYPMLDDRTGDGLATLLAQRGAGVRLSVAGGSVPPEPARVSRFRSRLAAAHPDLLVVSREEADSLLGGQARRAVTAALELRELAPVVIVTDAAGGSAAAVGDLRIEAGGEELPGPMLDATGSGDAFVAAVIADIGGGPGWPPSEQQLLKAMGAANRLGALVTRVLGAQGRVAGEPAAR